MIYKMLIINPGSTSTKIAVYENENEIYETNIEHKKNELDNFEDILSQKEFRFNKINETIEEWGLELDSFNAIVGRGGITKPLSGGTYTVDENMVKDLKNGKAAKHPSSLACIIAYEIATKYNIPSFTVDPVVTDEMEDVARLSGMPNIPRVSVFHALNQKAVARMCSLERGESYENCRYIVAHLGGGISIGAHRYGRVIDVNDALKGEGPFSPNRAGGLPVSGVLDLCFSGNYTKDEILDLFIKKGGLTAYLGTNSGKEVDEMINSGNDKAKLVFEAMAYQVSKDIGAMSTVLKGKVDNIILTGGLAYNSTFTNWVKQRVEFIAPVKVYPGEKEMFALASGALRVLMGKESALKY